MKPHSRFLELCTGRVLTMAASLGLATMLLALGFLVNQPFYSTLCGIGALLLVLVFVNTAMES